MTNAHGRIEQISVSCGGVPKIAVPRARIGVGGVEGDRQRNLEHHGGPMRAVCLFSAEVIGTLRGEGHPIEPGSTGENLTISGLHWPSIGPGTRLAVGDTIELEITRFTSPCKTISGSFADGRSSRILEKKHPGESRVYAKVLVEGEVAAGDRVEMVG